jgi:hypothetical protein
VKQIEVRHQFGDVTIVPASDRTGWSWEVTCWAETPELAQHFAEMVTLTAQEEAGTVRYQLNLPKPPVPELRGVESRLVLHVPEGVAVDLANSFGKTSAEGIRSGIARCEHGDLHFARVEGDLDARTSFGELRAQSVSGTARLNNEHGAVFASEIGGEAHIATSFGKVEAKEVTGPIIARNEHGAIMISSADADVEAKTSFGPIEATGVAGKLHARNEHGSITAKEVQGNVDAQSSFGKIELDTHAPNIVCRNEHGAIELTLRSESLARVEATTSFNPLAVHIAAPVTPRIEAHSDHGQIRSDYRVLPLRRGGGNLTDVEEHVPRMTLRNEHGSIHVVNALQNAESS